MAPARAAAILHEPIAELPIAIPPNATPANGSAEGDQRRKLHLSLGNGHGNGSSAPTSGNGAYAAGNGNGHTTEASQRANFTAPRPQQQNGGERVPQRPFQAPRNTP